MRRSFWLAWLVILASAAPAAAQITPTYTFVNGTAASADEVNANFALLQVALNRGGGTMTGTLNARTILASTDNTYDLGASGATRFRDFFLGRNATVGGTLGVTGASTIAALSATTGTFSSTLGVTGTSTLGATNTGAFTGTTGAFSSTLVSTGASIASNVSATAGLYYLGSDGLAYVNRTGGVLFIQTKTGDTIHLGGGTTFADNGLTVTGTHAVTGAATATVSVASPIMSVTTGGPARFYDSNNADYTYITNPGTNSATQGLKYVVAGSGGHVFAVTGSAVALVIANASGNVRMGAYGAGTATFDASGNITSISDERKKDIQGPFTAGLPELLPLAPILYKYKASTGLDTENVYAGFSAQNVLLTIPEAIGRDKDGFYSLNITPIIAALVTGEQQLAAEIDALRAGLGLSRKDRAVLPGVDPALRLIDSVKANAKKGGGQ